MRAKDFDGNIEGVKARVFEALDHIMAEDTAITREVWEAMREGYSRSGLNSRIQAQDPNDMAHAIDVINDYIQEDGFSFEQGILKDVPLTQHQAVKWNTPGHIQSEGIRGIEGSVQTPDLSAISDDIPPIDTAEQLRGLFHSAGKAFHGHGALAMLGFAGATMMAGMIGGAPTAPASPDGQAQGIQQENAMYEIPSTMAGQGTRSSANQSYIINVNASTDQGRDFATAAINQAFANIPRSGGGINMTMNIKDSSSNIGFGDIANYIQNMM